MKHRHRALIDVRIGDDDEWLFDVIKSMAGLTIVEVMDNLIKVEGLRLPRTYEGTWYRRFDVIEFMRYMEEHVVECKECVSH